MFQPPNVSDFKDFFDGGEFAYGEQPPAVRDKDIFRAQQEALTAFNPSLFPNIKDSDIAFNYLTAHFLILNMNAVSNGGLGQNFLVSSQSADSLSVTYSIPQELQKSAVMSMFLTTAFGIKYALMVWPRALANARGVVVGATTR